MSYSTLVAIPPKSTFNKGLQNTGDFLEKHFPTPGRKTTKCSSVTDTELKKLIVTEDVGPFRVTGFKPAVESLRRIFAKVKVEKPELYEQIRNDGMLCCRLIRGSSHTFSIHSWGCAIDLYCGSGVAPLGQPVIHQGVLELMPYFNEEGWYSGAAFSRPDAMHYEVGRAKLAEWAANGWEYVETEEEVEKATAVIVKNGVTIRVDGFKKDGHVYVPVQEFIERAEVPFSKKGTWGDGSPAFYLK